MRRSLKFLHVIGAMGLIGSMACLLVLMSLAAGTAGLADYAVLCRAMDGIATWIFFPSVALTLLAGLMAIAFHRGFHNAGWAWLKLATGILIFEGGFVSVLGPLQEQARRSAQAVAGAIDPSTLSRSMDSARNAVWLMLAIATVNVVLGIWRPRLSRSSE